MSVDKASGQEKSLEHLRHIRGNDSAVVEIGTDADKQKLLSVITNPATHSRDDLLNAVSSSFSGEAYGDVFWPKHTGGWTTPKEPTDYGNFRDMYPSLAKLSFDPGFMTHLPEFMEMAAKGEVPTDDPPAAREALKLKLGNKTMWRGTMLTDDELEEIKNGGNLSPLASYISLSYQSLDEFEAKALSTFPSYIIDTHFHGENRYTPFLSVSSYPDLAIAVGRHFGKKDGNRKFYLFKLNVPEIELVTYTDHAFRMPSKLRSRLDFNPDFGIRVAVDDRESNYRWDDDVESYLFWKIDPSEIVEITQPSVKKSSWNGAKTQWT